ncbi:MAG: vWA domain-containing protein [Pseudomonadota bacterium]
MSMNKKAVAMVGAIVLFAGYQFFEQAVGSLIGPDPVAPDWTAIAAWPGGEAEEVEAQPDPNRRITAIILDDSGSMRADIEAAKAAVTGALDAMARTDRVSVLALNAGTVLPFSTVEEARAALPRLLEPIYSDGGTPLTRSIVNAKALLAAEAARMRGFGTFRMIVTTDGQADDGEALDAAIEALAAATPIQLTTIGIGIDGRHVLRRGDLGAFVDVANVAALQRALEAAVAENANFTAITDFGDEEG